MRMASSTGSRDQNPRHGSAGWEWFDDMYTDTVVGEITITFDQHKVVVTATKSYEFIVGEYEVRSSS